MTQYLGWRWANWIVLILGAVATVLVCIIRETYPPTLLQRKTRQRRKLDGVGTYWCRYDQRVGLVELMKVNLSRPFVMAFKEPICIFWNVYISIVYSKPILSFFSLARSIGIRCLILCFASTLHLSTDRFSLVAASLPDLTDNRPTLPLLRRLPLCLRGNPWLVPRLLWPRLHWNRHW